MLHNFFLSGHSNFFETRVIGYRMVYHMELRLRHVPNIASGDTSPGWRGRYRS
jgi:hypothetical protein